MGIIPLYFLQIGFLLLLHRVSRENTVSVSLQTACLVADLGVEGRPASLRGVYQLSFSVSAALSPTTLGQV